MRRFTVEERLVDDSEQGRFEAVLKGPYGVELSVGDELYLPEAHEALDQIQGVPLEDVTDLFIEGVGWLPVVNRSLTLDVIPGGLRTLTFVVPDSDAPKKLKGVRDITVFVTRIVAVGRFERTAGMSDGSFRGGFRNGREEGP